MNSSVTRRHRAAVSTPDVQEEQATAITVLPARSNRAYELLAAQPASLIGLSAEERNAIVVTAVSDHLGAEHVVSRFGDDVWDFQGLIGTQNTVFNQRFLSWRLEVPRPLIDDAKAAMYVWWKQGKPGWKTVKVNSLISSIRQGASVLRYLAARGVTTFAEVKPIHLADYLQQRVDLGRAPKGIYHKLHLIDVVACFASELQHPLTFDPWGRRGLFDFCGIHQTKKGSIGKTPVIPPSVQAAVFNHAESVLARADEIFEQRGVATIRGICGDRDTEVRDAVLFMLLISTGMRNSEAMGVKNGSWRTEVKNGVTYHWVRTFEHKTGKGLVEFLATPETLAALELAQRYAAPYQERLRVEIAYLEQELRRSPSLERLSNSMTRTDALLRLQVARETVDCLFLAISRSAGDLPGSLTRVAVMTRQACIYQLATLARAAGVQWRIANHQCRRTFAWNVAQSKLGRRALIFLKWQFKHSSISMTELYASNPLQDDALYDEFYSEIVESKGQLISSWFEEGSLLSGGAGRKIMDTRAVRVESRASLLRHTAQSVNIRATGHGWCLAQQRGCVGEGMYEATRCVDCSSGVIDASYLETWRQIHLQNLELRSVKDCGPAVAQRVEREIARSAKVLGDLGVDVQAEDAA